MAASIKRGKRPRHLASNALWGFALCAGLSVTQASCSRPACELSESGCTGPALELLEPARLSLLKDVALELKIQKLFKSAPTDVRLQQPLSTGKQAELRQRLVCENLQSCSVLITAADLKTAKFEPGEVQLTALDAPESSTPLASTPVVLRIDHPQLVFAPAIEGGFLLPDVPVGWSNQGLRWAGVAPGLSVGQLAQVLIARAAVDTGSYDVNNLYALRYDAAGQTFAIAPRTNSLIGLSVLYSDAAFFWRLSRVNGPKEEYNVSRIDLRDLNGAETTLRSKLPLQSPPTMLAVTADGLQAVISDGTQTVSRFSTAGSDLPAAVMTDATPPLGLSMQQLTTAPQLAVVSADRVRLHDLSTWQQAGTSASLSKLSDPGPIAAMTMADLNGDGLAEVVTANRLDVSIYEQRADRSLFQGNVLLIPGARGTCQNDATKQLVRTIRYLGAGDLDGVRGPDLIIATEDRCATGDTPEGVRVFVFLHG